MIFLIPAKKVSTGYPGKNRLLFDFIKNQITSQQARKTYLISDDELLQEKAFQYGINLLERPKFLSTSETPILDVVKYFYYCIVADAKDIVCLLYLTYPERTKKDIEEAEKYFIKNKFDSMTCAMPVLTNPYRCFYETGEPVIRNTPPNRQDYKKIYEMSHFISMFKYAVIPQMNDLLMTLNHGQMQIGRKIDIDTQADYFNYVRTYGQPVS